MALVSGGSDGGGPSPRPRRNRPFYGAGALISPRNPAFNREERPDPGLFDGIEDIARMLANLDPGSLDEAPELKSPRFRSNNRPGRGGGGQAYSPPMARPGETFGGGGQDSALDGLFQQLMGSLNQGAPRFDYDQILKASIRDINDAYDAEAGAIRSNKKSARRRARGNRREMENMYEALAGTYFNTADRERKAGKNFARSIGNVYDRQERDTKKNNRQLMQEQAEMLKHLGIEDAAPDIMPDQTELAAEQLGDIAAQRGHAQSRARRLSKINRNYMQQGGQTARLEGTNRSADIQGDLEAYLRAKNDELAGVKSNRNMSISEMRSALQGQLAEQQSEYQGDLWDRLMGVANFKLDMDSNRADNELARLGLIDDRNDDLRDYQLRLQEMQMDRADDNGGIDAAELGGLRDVSQVLSGMGQRKGTQLMNIFNSALRSDSMQQRRFETDSGDVLKMTPERFASMLENIGREQGLRPSEINLLRLAAFQYLG